MKISLQALRRPVVTAVALILGLSGALPALLQGTTYAAQVTSRSIQLSSSTPGASGVQYKLTFTPVSNAQELIVDFCGDTPIIGANCAFSSSTVPTIATPVASVGTAATVGTGSPVHTVKVTGLTMTGGTPFTLTFTSGFTNPTGTGSFYARIITYTTGNAANYVPANTTGGATTVGTGSVDSGGDALSTVTQVSITATVMETLTFCVSGGTITGTCSGLIAPTLAIGAGTPPVLDTTGESAPAYTQVSTNALSGVNVRMKATNACTNGGLTVTPPDVAGGCSNIAGIGAAAAVLTGGTWGVCVAPGAGVTAAANYTDSVNSCPNVFNATSKYGMNGTNVTGTYGDTVYTTAAPVNAISSTLNFAAKAALTTPAGVYQGNEILIATGTF